MSQLLTVYSSIFPIDCHIIKGRLESEGIKCYIHDENIVAVHPYRAEAVGGVKLKVPQVFVDKAREILSLIGEEFLVDNDGVYQLREVFDQEIIRQEGLIRLRIKIRENPSILNEDTVIKEIESIADNPGLFIETERQFIENRRNKFSFKWKEFWYELLDYDGNIINYFRSKPSLFYLEEELLDNYIQDKTETETEKYICPICGSDNVIKSAAVDYNWSFLQVISVFLGAVLIGPGFFIPRRKYHCFSCGNNYDGN